MPVFVIAYFVLNKIRPILGKIGLIFAGIVFYIYGGIEVAAVFGISIVINYLMAVIIAKFIHKRYILAVAISSNVGILLFFKYLDFSIDDLVLPLGISFFTFQQIMYVVNIYNEKVSLKLIDYLTYILYFPKILMGPLVDPKDFLDQINDADRKKVDWDNIANGLKIFSLGLFKKMVLADTFAMAVNWAFSNIDAATSMDWLLAMLFYTFEIYFDFSGYTDMAVGVSNMINIRLPINFDSPYKATSIRDFWKRWHISLTDFFTKYIYIPLGGNKKGKGRTYVNMMIVFLISGVWHGSNWTFILWGVLHGLFNVFDRITEKYRNKINIVIQWMVTFLTVSVLWLLFRSDSIEQWQSILYKIFTFENISVSDGMTNAFVLPETAFVFSTFKLKAIDAAIHGLSLLLFTAAGFGICLIPKNNYRKLDDNSWVMLFISVIALVWGFLCLSSESVFVYFDF
ncbi:MAG: MBOAT family protein [Eubacterium sp.]|nr:MBOAT family protein [Eubacterium sp.]